MAAPLLRWWCFDLVGHSAVGQSGNERETPATACRWRSWRSRQAARRRAIRPGSFTELASTTSVDTFTGFETGGSFTELASTTTVDTQAGYHPAGTFVELSSTTEVGTLSGFETGGSFTELSSTTALEQFSGFHTGGSWSELASTASVDSFSGGVNFGFVTPSLPR